jgi:hypothetical protein
MRPAAPLQRGVDLPSLDVTYFTSLSYYILLLFGLRGVFMLFFREATIDETQMYRQQMGMGAARCGSAIPPPLPVPPPETGVLGFPCLLFLTARSDRDVASCASPDCPVAHACSAWVG